MLSLLLNGSRHLLLVTVATLVFSVLAFPGQVRGQDRSDYAASLLEALLANNRSIDQYDVMVTREVLTARPGGKVASFRSRCRYIVDLESSSRLSTCWIETDDWNGTAKPRTSKTISGLLVTPDGDGYLRDMVGIQNIPKVDVSRVLRIMKWPTFVTVGLNKFPDSVTVEGTDGFFWDRVFLGQQGLSAATISGKNLIAVKLAIEHTNADSVEYRWVFDQTKMVPIVREGSVRLRDGGKRILKERDRLQWKEISGVYVPTSINRTALRRMRMSDGATIPYESTDDTDFEWNEIGGELEASQFTIDSFRKIDAEEFLSISEWEESQAGK